MLENMVECSGNGTRQITGRHRAEDSAINSAEEFVCTCTCKVRSDGRDAISILVIISLLPFILFLYRSRHSADVLLLYVYLR